MVTLKDVFDMKPSGPEDGVRFATNNQEFVAYKETSMPLLATTNHQKAWKQIVQTNFTTLMVANNFNIDSIETINNFYNLFPYKAEEVDSWLPPSQFISTCFSRDCEDFAIAKFHALYYLGAGNDNLRIVLGRNQDNVAHAICVYYDYQLGTRYLDIPKQMGYATSHTLTPPCFEPLYACNLTHSFIFKKV